MEPARAKEISVLAVVAIATFLVVLLLGATVIDPNAIGNLPTLTALSILIWGALFSCSIIFLKDWMLGRYVLFALSGISVLAVSRLSIAGIVGGIIFGTLLLAASGRVTRELAARVKFQPRFILFRAMEMEFVALAFVAFFLSLPNLQQAIADGNVRIPAEVIQSTLTPLTPAITGLLPGYEPNATVDSLITQQLQNQQLAGIPIEGQIPLARQQISSKVGIQLTGDETVAQAVAARINRSIQDIAQGGGPTLIILTAVLALLTVRAVVPVITWIALGLAYGIIYLARKTALIKIRQEQAEVEKLHLA